MKDTQKQAAVVKSADRVLDILELLADERQPLGLAEIARKLDLPTSSTYKILQNLLDRHYLETDFGGKHFRLGSKILEIAAKYTENTDLISEFQQLAQKIVGDINESVFLSIQDHDKILYVSEKQSSHPVRFVSHLGMKLPIHATAMGKAMLSKQTNEEIAALFPDRALGRLTEGTVDDLDRLLLQLGEIRASGLAFSYGEAVQGIRCAAAPICNAQQKAVAAIGISVPEARLTAELWAQAQAWVLRGAKELTLRSYGHKAEQHA